MDRLEAMSILLHAVEDGSLSKAGRNLGLPLATVSRKSLRVGGLSEHHAFYPIGFGEGTYADAIRPFFHYGRQSYPGAGERDAERTASGEYHRTQRRPLR